MLRTYKYRIYPTKSQARNLDNHLEICRLVYNQTLAHRKESWEKYGKSLSLFETQKRLVLWKEERPDLKSVHSQVLQNVQKRVDLAFDAFFRRVKAGEDPGYPRFKGPGTYDSFTFPQSGFSILEGGKLHISKIGEVRIVLHRPIEGKIKTLTLHRSSTHKWYACFSVGIDAAEYFNIKPSIGIDVGLLSFATLSNGESIENPRFFRQDEKDLARAQRKLERQKKGSTERARLKRAVSRIHERIRDRRNDFAHQESRKLVNRFGTIVVEDLGITDLVQNRRLSKSIMDAAWSKFTSFLSYKAESAGGTLVKVNPAYTSQMCSACGHREKKTLSCRVHRCSECGLEMCRDQNAAINILALGLQSLG
jgi:putative transposase